LTRRVGNTTPATPRFSFCIRERLSPIAANKQHIEYKRELRVGDVVTVRSAVDEVKDKVIRLTHEMTNDETGEVAAIMHLVAVYFDTEARKSLPLPPDIRERASRMIVASPEPK